MRRSSTRTVPPTARKSSPSRTWFARIATHCMAAEPVNGCQRDSHAKMPNEASNGRTLLSVLMRPLCRLTRASPGWRPADHRQGRLGSLPIIPEVIEEARRQGVELTALPTEDACRLIVSLGRDEVHAVLHVTC
jgi:hypothetical protein